MAASSRPRPRRPDVTTVEIVGGVEKRERVIADDDCDWPVTYRRRAERIRAALGSRARQIEHIGSTSVPGRPRPHPRDRGQRRR